MPEENPAEETVGPIGSNPRYAAYDTTYEKFVGGVHYSKSAARDAGKAAGVKASAIDVREV